MHIFTKNWFKFLVFSRISPESIFMQSAQILQWDIFTRQWYVFFPNEKKASRFFLDFLADFFTAFEANLSVTKILYNF